MIDPETYFVPGSRRTHGGQNPRNAAFECAICQEQFERTSVVCQMPCHIKHIFHSECIKPWIKKQNACPLCKLAIPVDIPANQDNDNNYHGAAADQGRWFGFGV